MIWVDNLILDLIWFDNLILNVIWVDNLMLDVQGLIIWCLIVIWVDTNNDNKFGWRTTYVCTWKVCVRVWLRGVNWEGVCQGVTPRCELGRCVSGCDSAVWTGKVCVRVWLRGVNWEGEWLSLYVVHSLSTVEQATRLTSTFSLCVTSSNNSFVLCSVLYFHFNSISVFLFC